MHSTILFGFVSIKASFLVTISETFTYNLSSHFFYQEQLGVVTDLNNGNYTVSIRPTIAGFFNLEVNFLHGPEGKGDVRYAQDAYVQSQGAEYYGLSVGSSPFRVKVSNSIPEGITSTVSGLASIVNSTSSTVFSVTVRDAYYNVVLNGVSNVTVTIDGVLPSNFSVFNFNNGTYYVQYTPILSGVSELIVYVNNMTAFGTPFYVTVLDTFVHLRYTRVAGTNLHHGKKVYLFVCLFVCQSVSDLVNAWN